MSKEYLDRWTRPARPGIEVELRLQRNPQTQAALARAKEDTRTGRTSAVVLQ